MPSPADDAKEFFNGVVGGAAFDDLCCWDFAGAGSSPAARGFSCDRGSNSTLTMDDEVEGTIGAMAVDAAEFEVVDRGSKSATAAAAV